MRVRRAWLPRGLAEDVVVERAADGTLTAVRPGTPGDGPILDGLLLPGLVNAHTHVEWSATGAVPGGQGFHAWAGRLLSQPPVDGTTREAAGRRACDALVAAGTAVVVDVSNGGDTAGWLRDAGLRGIVQVELLGFDVEATPRQQARARRLGEASVPGEVVVRPAPHALFSTAPELVVDAVRCGPPGVPATIHVGEAEDEDRFLREGAGPLAALLDRLGRRWRGWPVPGCGAVEQLDRLGVLGPGLLSVHGVAFDDDDLARIAARRAPLVACPRSNLHIGGRLPALDRWIAHGVRFALGTDGLVSSPDLDVLGEVAVLAQRFPEIPVGRWIVAATQDGADAVGRPEAGRLAVGARPGLVLVDVGEPADLRRGPPARRVV